MTTATPWSRCSTMRRCTNSIDPTSRPRVGWLASSTLMSRLTSRATMTFCWFPPDRVRVGVATDEVRTSNSATRLTAFFWIASRFSAMPEANGLRS